MIKIDCYGLNTYHEKIPTYDSPDGRPEFHFTKVMVKGIIPQHHNVVMREHDMTPQQRANFLLEGDRGNISIVLKFCKAKKDNQPGGYFIRVPSGGYTPDKLLSDLARKWLNLIPDFNDYTETSLSKGKPLLLPPRPVETIRPARIEINFVTFDCEDWLYWNTPVALKMFGNHLTRAFNEFDAELTNIKQLEEPKKPIGDLLKE